jgi:crotonobetainyl-CoA:carnitine CoA-transferase CaiB-like acyl-CoA transferase
MRGEVPGQEGNHHPTQVPMGMFESADGLVNIAASSPRMWAGFCTALGAEELMERPEYQHARDRAAHKEQLRREVNEITKRFTTAELVERLNPAGVPCGPINTIGEAFEDGQVKYLRMTRAAPHPEMGDVNLLRSPINLSTFQPPDAFTRPAPDNGQHTDEVLREFGYDDSEIERLRAAGAIG